MVQYKVLTDISEAQQVLIALANDKPVFCDIETEKLYYYTRLIQVYQPSYSEVVYILDMDALPLQVIKDLLMALHTVWYNASYDLGTLNIVPKKVDDILYLVRTAYPQFMEFALGKVITKLSKMGQLSNIYEGIAKQQIQSKGFKQHAYLSIEQLTYAAADVIALAKIWELPKIAAVLTNTAYIVDILSLRHAIQYQQNGMIVDNRARVALLVETTKDIAKYRALLPVDFNPNSWQQVRALLGIAKSGHDDLVAYTLSGNSDAAFAGYIIALKKALKQSKYLESIDHTKMYTKFNVAGARTGRFTATGGDLPDHFNAQQIPRNLQPLFLHDSEGTCVVSEDYATLELRLAAAIYGDSAMYKQLMAGEDLHTAMAIQVTGKQLHPEGLQGSAYADSTSKWITHTDRTIAKSVNFGFVFGMSAAAYVSYAYSNFGITVTLEEAQHIRAKYFMKYTDIAKYHKYVWNNYKSAAFVYTTALGRKVKPRLGTDGINGPVQGSGAECTKLAVHYLIKAYPDAINYIFNVVHDAIYMRVPIADKALWTTRLQESMAKGWTEISKTSLFKYKDIPMVF